MKVVINKCYGGFSISKEAAEYMANLGCKIAKAELEESVDSEFYGYGYVNGNNGYDRSSEYLVKAVEVLGKLASGSMAELVVVEIPDGIEYYISDYDGIEAIHEKHRSWS